MMNCRKYRCGCLRGGFYGNGCNCQKGDSFYGGLPKTLLHDELYTGNIGVIAYVVVCRETGVTVRTFIAFMADYRKHVRDCLHDEL